MRRSASGQKGTEMIILDRFEGDMAVLETDEGMLEIERSELPDTAAEGDVLVNDDGKWRADREASDERRSRMREKMRRLLKKNDD